MEDLTRRGTPRIRPRPTGFVYPRTCKGCSAGFLANHHSSVWCSPGCKPPARECRACGISFRPRRDHFHQMHCSKACTVKVNGCSAGFYHPRTCKRCGERYQPASGRQQICIPCRPAPKKWECLACGQPFKPRSKIQKRCETCIPDRKAGARFDAYGITDPQWREMVATYEGLCWVCKTTQGQCVDHCHETGRVRGWLCIPCNAGLGHVERPGWLREAMAYLERGEDCRALPTSASAAA